MYPCHKMIATKNDENGEKTKLHTIMRFRSHNRNEANNNILMFFSLLLGANKKAIENP